MLFKLSFMVIASRPRAKRAVARTSHTSHHHITHATDTHIYAARFYTNAAYDYDGDDDAHTATLQKLQGTRQQDMQLSAKQAKKRKT
jgi:hypothetical protein